MAATGVRQVLGQQVALAGSVPEVVMGVDDGQLGSRIGSWTWASQASRTGAWGEAGASAMVTAPGASFGR